MNDVEIIRPLEIRKIDEEFPHINRDPTGEILFYRAVAAGALHLVQENLSSGTFESTENMGRLSKDPVRNLQYHFIVTAAMLCRFCAEGGMPVEEAFFLSDQYIQEIDLCDNITDIVLLHDKMAMDYTGRMRSLKKNSTSSKQIKRAIDYVYDHLAERITVDEMAREVGMSPAYLSRAFKKELGVSVSEYIRQRKLDAAKNLLCYSNYDYADIAAILSFASQSHLIQLFREREGMTPKQYREKNYLNNWNVNREG